MPKPAIRRRDAADLPACVDALAAVHRTDRYPSRWPHDPSRWLCPRGLLGTWVAVDGTAVLGHVALTTADAGLADAAGRRADRLASVSRLYVSPAARGLGLGARLLAAAADAATAAGLEPVLEVESGASAAIRLYERAGWTFTGHVTVADWIAPDGRPARLRTYLAPESVSGQPAR